MKALLPLAFLLPVLLMTTQSSSKPRGIRNNNPGNIRHGDKWVGMSPIQTDKSFVQFEKPVYGIRAMTKVLMSYQRRGVVTLGDILTTWAPPIENDTESYIKHAEKALRMNRGRVILNHNFPELIAFIIKHENGQQPYSLAMINQGVKLAEV